MIRQEDWIPAGRGSRRGRKDEDWCRTAKQIHFGFHLEGLLFALGFFSFSHDPAQFAGMMAVKRLGQSFAESGVLRVGNRHADPSHRLEDSPVRADHERQRQHQQPL